jgi:sec-independent protein translocase protein TatA
MPSAAKRLSFGRAGAIRTAKPVLRERRQDNCGQTGEEPGGLSMHMPGPTELMVIAMVALLIFGPRRMPEVGRSVGQALREFRKTSQEVMDTIQGVMEIDEPKPTPKRHAAPPTFEEED